MTKNDIWEKMVAAVNETTVHDQEDVIAECVDVAQKLIEEAFANGREEGYKDAAFGA